MKWVAAQDGTGVILFLAYFFLYGLEYFIPLRKATARQHFWTNATFAIVLVAVNLLFTSLTFWVANRVAENEIGLFHLVPAATWLQIMVSIIFLDFWAGYIAHVIFHKHETLWALHLVHHSDNHVDVTTTFRQHPGESAIRIFFNLSGMALLGIPEWMLLIYLTLSTINAQLEHANIRLPQKLDRALQLLIVTPNMHKIHHSKYQNETDSNYSNIFSVWDRLFRTYKRRHDYTSIEYGIDCLPETPHRSFWSLVCLPFRRAAKR